MNTNIKNSLTGIVLALSVASCGGDDDKKACGNLNVQGGTYNNATYSSAAYSSANGTVSADPTCRTGCEYKPSVGCCWCPD